MAKVESTTSSRSYQIELSIKGKNKVYGAGDIASVRIVSTLASAWQVVTIDLFINVEETILEQLYGQDGIKLKIKLLGQTEYPQETKEFDLMLITSEFDIPLSKELASAGQVDRSVNRLIAIPTKPYETMTKFVNEIYGVQSAPKTAKEIIEDLVSKTSATLEYDTVNANSVQIPQICIPPVTLYKAIQYIDFNFGLYNGVTASFCRYDNTLQIMNLSSRMAKAAIFDVFHLASDSKENDKKIQKSMDGKHFYTYDKIPSKYAGNALYSVLGNSLVHIVNPKDTLYTKIEQDLSTIIADYGIIDKNKKVPVNNTIESRKRYYIDHGGFDSNQEFANCMIAKRIFDLSRISILIERNLPIDNLLKVGSVASFSSGTVEHKSLTGKYILFSSDLTWFYGGEWQTTAKIELVRTNRTIT